MRGRSTLTKLQSAAPLRLLSPRSYGRAVKVVSSSYGGGLVAGDDVPVRISVAEGAACVMTTQSSSKVYRSEGRFAQQSLTATIADNAILAVLPDPLCCYKDAIFRQQQTFDVAPTGTLIWLDWLTSGRWASDERWQFHSFASRTDVRVGDQLVLRENLELNPRFGPIGGPACMGRFNCYAVLAAVGPQAKTVIEAMRTAVDHCAANRTIDAIASVAPIAGGAVARLIGPSAEAVQSMLRPMLSPLLETLGEDPWGRKW